MKKRSERKITRPRTPPPPRPSPPPNLRHRASLRCPPKLSSQQDADSANAGSARLPGRRANGSDRAGPAKGGGSKTAPDGANGGRGGGGGRVLARQVVEERRAMSAEAGARGAELGREGVRGFDRRRAGERSAAAFTHGACRGRSVPWGGREGETSGARGAQGFKRSLDERGPGETNRGSEREPQRPRRLEASRAAIPVDAVIVEVRFWLERT